MAKQFLLGVHEMAIELGTVKLKFMESNVIIMNESKEYLNLFLSKLILTKDMLKVFNSH